MCDGATIATIMITSRPMRDGSVDGRIKYIAKRLNKIVSAF
jgi:hypothetical protein